MDAGLAVPGIPRAGMMLAVADVAVDQHLGSGGICGSEPFIDAQQCTRGRVLSRARPSSSWARMFHVKRRQ
ncbi:MAG: hypothetical protein BRC32_05875 [Actinobacteria bacterium QS_8_72_14]|nr:MAG: hypothetical protein BRC32_05875 [Actinobacteria bacterium QS_8_72_14]